MSKPKPSASQKPAPVSKPSVETSNGFDWLEQVELAAMDRSRHGRPT